jgi:hypothetical protein
VHPRTIERRIASSKIQSRRTDDGQLQVLIVDAPDETASTADPLETVRELAQDQVSLATGSASAIVRLSQADAERARSELDLVRQDAGRARITARIACSALAGMGLSVCVAVGWTVQRITESREQINAMQERAERTQNEAQKLLAERDAARSDAEHSRIASAEASGRLAAYLEQSRLSDNRPTTRPATLIQRIADAVAGE